MTTDKLNESVSQIIVALIQANKISMKVPANDSYEEITSAIKRVKQALS